MASTKNTTEAKPSKLKWKYIQPFALLTAGSLFTFLGSALTQCSENSRSKYTQKFENQRMKFTLTQDRHKEALNFLEKYSSLTAERTFATNAYFEALKNSDTEDLLRPRKKEYYEASKELDMYSGMIITLGHQYFGDEFKDYFHKVFLFKLLEIDESLSVFEKAQTEEVEKEISKLKYDIDLLHGELLGMASRRIRDSQYSMTE